MEPLTICACVNDVKSLEGLSPNGGRKMTVQDIAHRKNGLRPVLFNILLNSLQII